MSSSRLPGKALKTICGRPSISLLIERLKHSQHPLCCLTSNDPSDDILEDLFMEQGISYFRGSLTNVLERFHQAFLKFHPQEWIIRLTADNLFMDYDLINALVSHFESSSADYTALLSSSETKLPYGISAEIFRSSALELAYKKSHAPEDIENVTPWIRKHLKASIWAPEIFSSQPDMSDLRCTLDTPEDYVRLTKIFENVSNPIQVSWFDLCQALFRLETSR